jgi:predicted N-acyltransferase
MGHSISVVLVDTFADVEPTEWDGLVQASGAPAFYSAAYLRAYEQAPIAPIDAVRYLLARVDGRPVMAAPLYLYRHLDPFGRLRLSYPLDGDEPGLLSHVWHCYDSQLVTAPAAGNGAGPSVVDAVIATMRQTARQLGARWCGFVNVERGSPTHRALTAAGLPAHHLEDRFAADLTGVPDLAAYLARIPARDRQNLRRRRRRAADAGVEVAVRPVPSVDVDEIAALCRQTAGRFGNSGFYPDGVFERFLALLGPLAQVIEIRQRGRLVGACICLLDGERLHTWTGGYDYEVDGSFSPYAVGFVESIELALRLGRRVLEGGRRNAGYKLRFGLTARHLDACLVPA